MITDRPEPAVEVTRLSHHYGARRALDQVSFRIDRGEVFVFLGPNGGGKTTLFRVLSTLIPVQSGDVTLLGFDVTRDVMAIRERIGVVFQAPSLDKKLTVRENLAYQAALYGIGGRTFEARQAELLGQLGLTDRAGELTEQLSGGLRRRVELAKGLLHAPDLLLLDEPSTGLDPGARADLWEYLGRLRDERGVTVVLTTHLLEEAERADRIAILDQGKLVALDSPAALKATVGGDTITIDVDDPSVAGQVLRDAMQLEPHVVDGQLRLEHADGHRLIPQIVDRLGQQVRAVVLGKPSLEDVFIAKTGHRFHEVGASRDDGEEADG